MRSDRAAALLSGGVAIALLAGAYGFQYLGNLAPCEMCWWQRYALMATAALAGLALATRSRGLAAASIATLFVNAGIAAFHVGVEQHWWQGITACAAPMVTGTTADVISQMMAQPLVRCDAIAWSLFGISMAGWNALVSTAIGGTALWRLTR
jgi:disulfide bond formation protein DsbB